MINNSVIPHQLPHTDYYNRTDIDLKHQQQQQQQHMTELDYYNALEKNKNISTSAISRAVHDASIGQYGVAIETLVTAMSLIKQSRIANDDNCKLLLNNLQDTKLGIEDKYYGRQMIGSNQHHQMLSQNMQVIGQHFIQQQQLQNDR
jgi:hypothetical protein